MKILWISLFFLSTTALSQQLKPNDPTLAQNPEDTRTTIPTYAEWSALDRLALALGDTPEEISLQLDATVDAIVITGLRNLREKGFDYNAGLLEQDYNQKFKNYFHNHRDLFDHDPWSQWLVTFYNALETCLGYDLTIALHLDDIKLINYAITVAFDPTNPQWDIVEYRKHFVPLAGSISYWAAYISCVAVTYGSGAIAMVCSPIGEMVEYVMRTYIAPPLSDKVYDKANHI